MGKGDKKTRRGKISIGSFGVRRPHRIKKEVIVEENSAKEKPKKIEEPKPKKVVEEPVIIVEPVIEKEIIVEVPAQAELALDIQPVKAPVKKAAAKKVSVKAEKEEKPEVSETKPKTAKPKKKAAEPGDEKPSEE